MSKKRALILEDTAANRLFFERLLSQAGFDIIATETGREAMDKLSGESSLDLAILDMEIPDINGLEMTVRIRKRYPDTCIVVATMHDDRSSNGECIPHADAMSFLVKPHGFMDLFKRLTRRWQQSPTHQNRPLVIDQFGPRPFTLRQHQSNICNAEGITS